MEKRQDAIPYAGGPHSIMIEDRRRVKLTGVTEIEDFHEEETTLLTEEGTLTIWGRGMKLGKLDPDSGQVLLEGEILSLEYEQPPQRRFRLFNRK